MHVFSVPITIPSHLRQCMQQSPRCRYYTASRPRTLHMHVLLPAWVPLHPTGARAAPSSLRCPAARPAHPPPSPSRSASRRCCSASPPASALPGYNSDATNVHDTPAGMNQQEYRTDDKTTRDPMSISAPRFDTGRLVRN